jgi:hypothetical protein
MANEKSKSKILSPEELKILRQERSKTLEVILPVLEAPKPFPTLADLVPAKKIPTPPPFNKKPLQADLAPVVPLPLAKPGSTDQRRLETGPHYSGLIRRRPRKAAA